MSSMTKDFESRFEEEKQIFWRDGFIIIRHLFESNELDILRQAVISNSEMTKVYKSAQQEFVEGNYPSFKTIFVWNDVFGDDLFSLFTRRASILDRLEYYLDDTVYLYHNKVTL